MMNLPPAYEPTAEELPAYSGHSPASPTLRPALQEYAFGVKGSGKTIVAELILTAPPHLSKHIPTYREGSPIGGRIILRLANPERIQEVNLYIRGDVFSLNKGWEAGAERVTFLNVHERVWVPETNDSKLNGVQEWAFSVFLPSEVSVPVGNNQEIMTFRLPETSTESSLLHSISYETTLHIRRARFKTDYRVGTYIGIIPLIRPDPPSMLRQLAYQEQTPVSGPELDPEGWHTLDPVSVHGTVFGVRSANLRCTLSLAKPLSYTRGTLIPLSLLLQSEDEQAVDLLSSPGSIVVRLRRVVRHHVNKASNPDVHSWKDFQDDYRLASFLPPTKLESSSSDNMLKRQLYGEVHLDKALKPTTSIVNVRIEYFVVFFPFESPGYESEGSDPIAVVPVEIATSHAQGPPPRRYAPLREDSSGSRKPLTA